MLLYLDQPDEALAIGKLYRDAFPGEADAVGVYATTLAAAGKLDEAVAAAEDAVRLSEGEDTLAGLAKVLALRGDHARAKELYQRALDKAGPSRRPLRRAALAMLQWIDGDLDLARATVAPCLPGGADDAARERGACLFVAGVIDPANAEPIAAQLDALAAAATPTAPAYGAPRSLAALVRARAAVLRRRLRRRRHRLRRSQQARRGRLRAARRLLRRVSRARTSRPGSSASSPRSSPPRATATSPPRRSAAPPTARRAGRGSRKRYRRYE